MGIFVSFFQIFPGSMPPGLTLEGWSSAQQVELPVSSNPEMLGPIFFRWIRSVGRASNFRSKIFKDCRSWSLSRFLTHNFYKGYTFHVAISKIFFFSWLSSHFWCMNQQKKAERPNIGLAHIFGDLAAKKKRWIGQKMLRKKQKWNGSNPDRDF